MFNTLEEEDLVVGGDYEDGGAGTGNCRRFLLLFRIGFGFRVALVGVALIGHGLSAEFFFVEGIGGLLLEEGDGGGEGAEIWRQTEDLGE